MGRGWGGGGGYTTEYGLRACLHVHPIGFHLFILDIKLLNGFNCYISAGTKAHVFGPLYASVSVPL